MKFDLSEFLGISNAIKKHERLIIVLAVLGCGLFLTNKFLNHRAEVATQKATAAQAQLQTVKQQNAQQAVAVAQVESQYEAVKAEVDLKSAELEAEIQKRQQVTVAQQKQDMILPLPDVTKRWQQLVDLPPSDFTPAQNGVTVSLDGARQTVSQLELVPKLTADNAAQATIVSEQKKQIQSLTDVRSGLQKQVSGLNDQIDAGKKSCQLQVSALKAQAKKGKFHAFLHGVEIGGGVAAAIVAYLLH